MTRETWGVLDPIQHKVVIMTTFPNGQYTVHNVRCMIQFFTTLTLVSPQGQVLMCNVMSCRTTHHMSYNASEGTHHIVSNGTSY